MTRSSRRTRGVARRFGCVLAAVLVLGMSTSANAALIGSQASSFSLLDQDNATVSLSDYAGTGVILDFCAVWCFPCRQFYSDVYPSVPGNALVLPVLMENHVGLPSSQPDALAWSDAFGLERVAHLNGDADLGASLVDAYLSDLGALAYPTFVFIDANLTVVGNITGLRRADDAEWARYVSLIESTQSRAVPEPASVALLGAGLAWLLVLRRRRVPAVAAAA